MNAAATVGAIGAILLATAVRAGGANNYQALALSALVAPHSPNVSVGDKKLLSLYLNGHPHAPHTPGHVVTVTADEVTCRSSDVDLTLHECKLVFGTVTRMLHGRSAHELFATLAEAGAPSEGAAGSIYNSVKQLACTIAADGIEQEDGSGAACTYL